MFVPDLPKTRSGKIMRRLLRDIAEGRRWATPRRSPTRASSRRSARTRAPRRSDVPFDFLKRKKAARAAAAAPRRRPPTDGSAVSRSTA